MFHLESKKKNVYEQKLGNPTVTIADATWFFDGFLKISENNSFSKFNHGQHAKNQWVFWPRKTSEI